jgi:WD40 repeat protein
MMTAAADGTARLWNAQALGLALLGELRGHTAAIRAAAFSPNGRFAATASEDRTTRVWEVATRRTLLELRGHDGPVISVDFAHDGAAIVTGGTDCRALVYSWSISQGSASSQPIP